MIFISHRGNLNRKNPDLENNPNQINYCLNLGLNVEVDVWFEKNHFWLGHDKPLYQIEEDFLENDNIWCHAKNQEALFLMLNKKKIHCFWHEKDQYTITSKGIIWAFPNSKLNEKSVCVLPEICEFQNFDKCFGICSDKILDYQF